MKKNLLLFFTCCIFTTQSIHAQCASPATGVSSSNLVVHVPFTNGAGTDLSQYSHTNTLNGTTIAADRFTNSSNAVVFSGANSGGNIPHHASMVATNQITLAAWVNSSSITSSQRIIDKLAGISAGNFMLDLYQSKIRFFVSSAVVNPTTVLSSNLWYHIVCTYDGTQAKVYLNGSLLSSVALTSNLTSNSNPFLIGKDQNNANPFIGRMDDIKYYTRALTAQEVSDLYEEPGFASHTTSYNICGGSNTALLSATATSYVGAVSYKWKKGSTYLSDDAIYTGTTSPSLSLANATPAEAGQYILETYSPNCIMTSSDTMDVSYSNPVNPDQTGLILHYKLNDLSGHDDSGNNLTATMGASMSKAIDQNNIMDGAVNWSGLSTGYASVPHNSLMNLTNEVTVSFWIYIGNLFSTNVIIDKLPGTTTNNLFIDLQSNVIRFFCAGGSVTASTPIMQNGWTHVACTYDGSNCKVYINGVQSGLSTFTGSFVSNTSPLVIGARQDGNFRFGGRLNDIRMYSRALSHAEILMDKDLAEVVKQPFPVSACLTENIRFSTSVSSNSPITYQWFKDGVALVNGGNVNGATNDTLTISNAQMTDMGNYTCKFSNAICTPYSTDTVSLTAVSNVNVSNENLVMYFPMSNNSGIDMSGNGLHMSTMIGNFPDNDKDNNPNEAISLTSTASQLNVTSSPLMFSPNSNFTFSIWIKPTTTNDQRIIEKGTSYLIDIYQTKIRLHIAGFTLISNQFVLANTWQHVVCTSDGSYLKIYINGNLDISYYFPVGVLTGNHQFLFGKTLYPQGGNYYTFNGVMDEFRFYTRALNLTEIKGLYFAASQKSAPVSSSICEGANNTLSVNAISSGTINYQWYYNGAAISGATQNNYTVNGLNASNAGAYICEVTSGCSSIMSDTANLSILPVEVSTSLNGATITAVNIVGNTFQWLDCNNGYAEMPGNTGLAFTAIANGNYAVKVTSNGCVDTSLCTSITTVGINERSLNSSFKVKPNPAKNNISIELDGLNQYSKIEIVDVSGRVILLVSDMDANSLIDIKDISSGLYFIRVTNESKIYQTKFVKE